LLGRGQEAPSDAGFAALKGLAPRPDPMMREPPVDHARVGIRVRLGNRNHGDLIRLRAKGHRRPQSRRRLPRVVRRQHQSLAHRSRGAGGAIRTGRPVSNKAAADVPPAGSHANIAATSMLFSVD
jgi:hypothetical protein